MLLRLFGGDSTLNFKLVPELLNQQTPKPASIRKHFPVRNDASPRPALITTELHGVMHGVAKNYYFSCILSLEVK